MIHPLQKTWSLYVSDACAVLKNGLTDHWLIGSSNRLGEVLWDEKSRIWHGHGDLDQKVCVYAQVSGVTYCPVIKSPFSWKQGQLLARVLNLS